MTIRCLTIILMVSGLLAGCDSGTDSGCGNAEQAGCSATARTYRVRVSIGGTSKWLVADKAALRPSDRSASITFIDLNGGDLVAGDTIVFSDVDTTTSTYQVLDDDFRPGVTITVGGRFLLSDDKSSSCLYLLDDGVFAVDACRGGPHILRFTYEPL